VLSKNNLKQQQQQQQQQQGCFPGVILSHFFCQENKLLSYCAKCCVKVFPDPRTAWCCQKITTLNNNNNNNNNNIYLPQLPQ